MWGFEVVKRWGRGGGVWVVGCGELEGWAELILNLLLVECRAGRTGRAQGFRRYSVRTWFLDDGCRNRLVLSR